MALAQAGLGFGILSLCSSKLKVVECDGVTFFAEGGIVTIGTANHCVCCCACARAQGGSGTVYAGQGGHSIFYISSNAIFSELILCFKVSFSVIFFFFAQTNKDHPLCCDTG